MSDIGFYRVKKAVSVDTDVDIYINNLVASTKSIKVNDICDGDKRLKFLNKNGQYRFIAFNRFWEGKDKTKEIGKASKIITSLLTSQTSEDSIGNKNTRVLNLRSDNVSADELEVVNDIWTSPRIYLYIGDGITDEEADWIQVTIKSKKPIINIRKGSYTDIVIDVTLPKHYTINML